MSGLGKRLRKKVFEIRISKEYEEFIRREFEEKRFTFYEKACNLSEKILPISPGKERERKLKEAINFCHLAITPRGAFSFSILITVSLLLLVFFLGLFKLISIPLIILSLMALPGVFYYFYNYPFSLATSYRIKATSDMVLAVIYISVAMKMRPNLENAIAFTAHNLSGPLSLDLKELLWGVYTGKYVSMSEAIDDFIEKWKRENKEFTQAINLIKTSFYEGYVERGRVLDEAVSLVLEGTKDRMKHYSQDLRTSLTVLNALGILLPIIGLVFFPILSIFMPEAIKPMFIALGYDIILPSIVFFLMKTSLTKRPPTFHQPELSKHYEFRKRRFFNVGMIVPFIVFFVLSGFGSYRILYSYKPLGLEIIVYSLMITWGISGGIITYCFLSTHKKLKIREDIVSIENELGAVLFQLGHQLRGGMPIENGIERIEPRIKELKISEMFNKVLSNIRNLGMTFGTAIFDKDVGAINFYPSRLVSAIMRAVVDISKSGMIVLSQSLISISTFLKNMRATEEYLRDMLAEITSTMKTQALLLAPLASGVVVGLVAMLTKIMANLQEWLKSFQSLGSYGPVGSIRKGILSSFLDFEKMIPVPYFQLIVGIYMIEVVVMITVFLSLMEHGEDKLIRRYNIGKMLLFGTLVYTFTVVLVYSLLSSLIPTFGGV